MNYTLILNVFLTRVFVLNFVEMLNFFVSNDDFVVFERFNNLFVATLYFLWQTRSDSTDHFETIGHDR